MGVDVDFRMFKLRDRADQVGEPILWGPKGIVFKSGDWIAWRITNNGGIPADVTLFHIDRAYHIQAVFPSSSDSTNRLEPGRSFPFIVRSIYARNTGPECMVLLAVKANRPPLDLTVLAEPTWETAQSRDRWGLRQPAGAVAPEQHV